MRRVTLCRVIDIIAITTNEFLQDSCPFRFLLLPALAGRPDIIAYPARAAKNVTPVTGLSRHALYLLLPHEPGQNPVIRAYQLGRLMVGGGSLATTDNLVRLVAGQFGHVIESSVKLPNPVSL